MVETQERAMDFVDLEGAFPKNFPMPGGPHRVYMAVTNHCNRACPWCCAYSSPKGNVWLTLMDFVKAFPERGPFEVYLEGGEPTLHPQLHQFISTALANPGCQRVEFCTNGAVIPRAAPALAQWVDELGARVDIKLSINHHLLERDPGLPELARSLAAAMDSRGGRLTVNVRLRRGVANDDDAVRQTVREAGLLPYANVFFLRRYGLAAGELGWEPPVLVGRDFRMVNPDGEIFGPDLPARSEALRRLME